MAKYFPDRSIFGDWQDNVLWIKVKPQKIKENAYVAKTTTVSLTDVEDADAETYFFLAPEELQENIKHTWEPIQNIVSTFSQKVASTAQVISQDRDVFKADTPLMYKDSERRQITFNFQLAHVTGKKNTAKEQVVDPIKNLMKWSSPNVAIEKKIDKIELPYVFTIRSVRAGEPVDIINIKAAAISDIQPTYYHPYIQGYPCRCEFTVTFVDLEPLTRVKSFDKNIRTSSS